MANDVHRDFFLAKRREIISDAAALLHRESSFLQAFEDAVHVVRNGVHHETIE